MSSFQKVVLLYVCLTFLWLSAGFAQNNNEALVSEKMYQRAVNAIQNYIKDEMSYFEGFMLCTRYQEKMKLLESLDRTVKTVDTFSDEKKVKDDPQVNIWKSQAHFLYGIALGLLGEKTTAEFELGLAQKYFLGDTTGGWDNLLNREIEVGEVKDRLRKYEEIYLNHIDDLGAVRIVVNEKKFAEVGTAISIKQIELGNVSHPRLIPHVIAYSEEKLTNALVRGSGGALLYLPTGKFQIYNTNKGKLLSEFRVKDVNQEKSVKLPQRKLKFGFYFLILGSGIVTALGL